MKQTLQNLFAYLARKILAKYQPFIIAVTGSVGKTSTRDAVFAVVSQKYVTRKSEKNYNNEFGLPFTIIDMQAPGTNILLWLSGIFKALLLLARTVAYPEVLVLEMGVDKPGDMDYLLSIAKPNIAIITSIGISHYGAFESPDGIAKEKGKLAEALTAQGTLIVNADNEGALAQKHKTSAHVVSYGTHTATVHISNIKEDIGLHPSTLLTIVGAGQTFDVVIQAIGTAHIYSALAATATGAALGIEPDLIIKGLKDYKPAPGRLNIISGIKKTVIIDDTYNAAPDSMNEALIVLEKFPAQYKIAVLGDMLELGNLSDEQHYTLGKKVASMSIDRLLTVGSQGKIIADAAHKNGMAAEQIISFDSSDQAQIPLQNMLPPGAVILIKGSQGMRMEKITKEIMAEPMRAEQLLCRQYGKWLSNS